MFASQASRRSVEAPNPNNLRANGIGGAFANRVSMQAGSTSNIQGSVGGPITIAYVQLVVRASGFFLWTASYSMAAAAATEVLTTTVQTQFGTGVVTPTGGTSATSANSFQPLNGTAILNSAAPNTNLTFTGGGGAVTVENPAITIAGVGYNYSGGGMIFNAAAGGFTLGNNVFLTLAVTNSATSRICSQINMSLIELP